MTYFLILRTEKPSEARKYTEEIQLLQQEFNFCFQDIHKYEATIDLLPMPFDVNNETVPAKFQMEMTDLQFHMNLSNTF
jgi:hypothetical protein